MRFVAFECAKPASTRSNYRGLSGGLDGVARGIVWNPRFAELVEAGSLPSLRAWLFGQIRAALEDAVRVRQPDGDAPQPGSPATSGMGVVDLGDGSTP
jgi:hypothetical protein